MVTLFAETQNSDCTTEKQQKRPWSINAGLLRLLSFPPIPLCHDPTHIAQSTHRKQQPVAKVPPAPPTLLPRRPLCYGSKAHQTRGRLPPRSHHAPLYSGLSSPLGPPRPHRNTTSHAGRSTCREDNGVYRTVYNINPYPPPTHQGTPLLLNAHHSCPS